MSYKIKLYIVEDEYITQAVLKNNLEEIGYEVVGMADSAETAWEEIQKLNVDLAILDINLAGEQDGIWLARKIRESLNFPFIFLTAYGDKGTVDTAVKTTPNGYLLKPFNQTDIYTAIEVAVNNFNQQQQIRANQTPQPTTSSGGGNVNLDTINVRDNTIFLKVDKVFYKIGLTEIVYIKSDSNYLEVYLEDKKHVVRSTLKNLLELLPTRIFVQTHRSYVINGMRIRNIGDGQVTLNDGSYVPLSDNFKTDVLTYMLKN